MRLWLISITVLSLHQLSRFVSVSSLNWKKMELCLLKPTFVHHSLSTLAATGSLAGVLLHLIACFNRFYSIKFAHLRKFCLCRKETFPQKCIIIEMPLFIIIIIIFRGLRSETLCADWGKEGIHELSPCSRLTHLVGCVSLVIWIIIRFVLIGLSKFWSILCSN